MRELKKLITSRQSELKKHALFELIDTSCSPAPLATMARALVWWPMVFQDVLRLNVQYIQGSGLERFAEFHRNEDAGHDRWFLDDLLALGVDRPALDELFGDDCRPIRDACYALVAEVFREQPGAERITLLLSLETTGHVFFEQVCVAVERLCPELPLRYFARSHLGVEKDHDLFTDSTTADLDRIVLNDVERAACEALVSRTYDVFAGLFSYLAERINDGTRYASDVRELGTVSVPSRVEGYARSS